MPTPVTLSPNRIEIKWRPPLDPKIWGYGDRIDPGGYCYAIFRNGRRYMSGSDSADLARVKIRTLYLAADGGITDPDMVVFPKPH